MIKPKRGHGFIRPISHRDYKKAMEVLREMQTNPKTYTKPQTKVSARRIEAGPTVRVDWRDKRREPGTETEKPKKFTGSIRIPARASGTTFSSFKMKKKPKFWDSFKERLLPPQQYVVSAFSKLVGISGSQTVNGRLVMSNTDLNSYFSQIAADYTSEIYVTGCHLESTFSNLTNSNVYCKIYHLICRKPTSRAPSDAMIQGLKDQGLNDTSAYTIGLTPFDSRALCQEWMILGKPREFELGEGRCHIHKATFIVRKRIVLRELLDAPAYVPGFSSAYLIIFNGAPGINTTTTTDITTAPVTLGVVHSEKHMFRYMSPNTAKTVETGTLTRNVNVRIIDEASGNIEIQEAAS